MATLVLTVVGTVVGGPIGGAIGALIGQTVDQAILFKPKGREGRRLEDLRLQTSRYGDQVPRIFGTMRVAGSVIWATDLKENRNKQGGGKGQPSVTTYSYSASFAVALSSRGIVDIGRIWADGNLLRGAAGDFKTALGSFRIHDGSEDQALDPLIAADKGSMVTPAHRGTAYAVFEGLELADFGNRIPSLTFELVADGASVAIADIASDISGGAIAAEDSSATPRVAGYAASGTVADALSPLADGYDLALRSGGAGLRLTRDGPSEAALAENLIGAAFNGKSGRGERIIRGKAEDVPVRLNIRHYDAARDYQAGVQTSVRPGPGRQERDFDMPAVLAASDARALAEQRLQGLWAARKGVELRCDWRALTLEPGMVVTLEGRGGSWRIKELEWEGGGVRLKLTQAGGGGVVVPTADPGVPIMQADLLHGATSLVVADLPVPGDALPTAPVVAIAAAGTQAGWRSAELFVEDAVSGGLTSIGGTAAPATMGTVSTVPDSEVAPQLFDTVSSVNIDLLHSQMTLSNADDAALLSGANAALLGREVVQFGTAVQTGPASWRLGRLLRGRRGTEWAMAGHGAGERFLLLEENTSAAVPSTYAVYGSTVLIDAISIGDVTPAQGSEQIAGQAILPVSPVFLSGTLSSGDWRFGWIRRSRLGWSWTDGADAPLGEEQELYRIDLSQGGAIFRSATVSVPQWIYDAASIAADTGAGLSGTVDVAVRQVGTFGAGRSATMIITI
ncbi:MAG: phage tail protein [Sphingobium sp.]